MNHVEPGKGKRPDERPARSPGPSRSRKKIKKRAKNLLPVIILGVGGVVVIALIIMGLKTIFTGDETKTEPSSILQTEVSAPPTAEPAPTPTPGPTSAAEADITGLPVTQYSDMVIVGDRAFDYYKFDQEKADRFVAAVNQSASGLGAGTNVYGMIIPGAADVMLPLHFLEDNADKTSDQEKAIRYINSGISGMKHVELYPALKAHCNEKLYFYSDNHWTGLAAYYAYSQWAYEKGVSVSPLSDYETVSMEGFLGNQYSFTEHSGISEPETVEVYKPKANLVMLETGADGTETESPWILDVSAYPANEKYKAFLGNARGLTKLGNKDLQDASACILVGDANSAPLAPYLAAHYQYTYFVDYRSFEGSLSSLAQETGATDVVYALSIAASAEDSLIQGLEGL